MWPWKSSAAPATSCRRGIPVTVKMRRGIDDTAESRDKFFAILDGAFQSGVAAVTVHARTVRQRYVGPSQWAFLAEVKRHAGSRTMLGSGDLFSAAACLEMMRQTGVDGVTVARGAIGNPWIFQQARELAAGRAAASAAHAARAAGCHPGALSAGRRTLRREGLRPADEEVRHQVLRPAPAARAGA